MVENLYIRKNIATEEERDFDEHILLFYSINT